VIPNGADETFFKPLDAATLHSCRNQLPRGALLLTVGNVTKRKGQGVVIRALPRILEQCPDTHYLIAGLPTDEAVLARLARELGVSDHVHFLGRVSGDKLVSLYSASDIFVMTSVFTSDGDYEGYGIAVVEAALCGKPAVVSGKSGLAEAVDDGETGLVVQQDDPEATARAVITLLQDDDKRRKMGEVAQERALRSRTWRNRVEAYDRLFRTLVSS
jgi:phosphatidylinositol alpha-1,6-mannosyltransferase